MDESRLSETEIERRLAACRARYAAAKSALADVGFTCEGSLVERYTCCNNPNCHCADPNQRHGPYYQLSWKEAGKTVSRLLSGEEAALYREWIDNRRHLESVLQEMRDLSRQADEYLLAKAGKPFHGPDRPDSRRRSAS
jgi:hypothetical protein